MNFVPVALVIAAMAGTNTSQPTDYKTAFHRSQQDDRPLVVLVSAKWCPPCQMMKKTTIPSLVDANGFSGFHFAMVDLDEENKNARNLIGSRGVPQLIVFEKVDGQWSKRFLSGYHDVASVEDFLHKSDTLTRTANAQVIAAGK